MPWSRRWVEDAISASLRGSLANTGQPTGEALENRAPTDSTEVLAAATIDDLARLGGHAELLVRAIDDLRVQAVFALARAARLPSRSSELAAAVDQFQARVTELAETAADLRDLLPGAEVGSSSSGQPTMIRRRRATDWSRPLHLRRRSHRHTAG